MCLHISTKKVNYNGGKISTSGKGEENNNFGFSAALDGA